MTAASIKTSDCPGVPASPRWPLKPSAPRQHLRITIWTDGELRCFYNDPSFICFYLFLLVKLNLDLSVIMMFLTLNIPEIGWIQNGSSRNSEPASRQSELSPTLGVSVTLHRAYMQSPASTRAWPSRQQSTAMATRARGKRLWCHTSVKWGCCRVRNDGCRHIVHAVAPSKSGPLSQRCLLCFNFRLRPSDQWVDNWSHWKLTAARRWDPARYLEPLHFQPPPLLGTDLVPSSLVSTLSPLQVWMHSTMMNAVISYRPEQYEHISWLQFLIVSGE